MGRRVLVRLGEGIPGRRNSINKGSEVCYVWKETESGGAYNQRLAGGVEDTEQKRGTGQVRPQSQAMEAGISLMSHRITFKTVADLQFRMVILATVERVH